jgi:hypothetical protein
MNIAPPRPSPARPGVPAFPGQAPGRAPGPGGAGLRVTVAPTAWPGTGCGRQASAAGHPPAARGRQGPGSAAEFGILLESSVTDE